MVKVRSDDTCLMVVSLTFLPAYDAALCIYIKTVPLSEPFMTDFGSEPGFPIRCFADINLRMVISLWM